MSAKNFEDFINDLLKDAIKIKEKHSPISERVGDKPKQLEIKNIYQLINYNRNLYLLQTKHYEKTPKYRYFLSIVLANVSSDLLVELAKDFALENNFRLLQYSLYPKNLRTNLLSLKEFKKVEDYERTLKLLEDYKKIFQENLDSLKEIVKNK